MGRDKTFRETEELPIRLVGQKSNRPSWGEMSSASDELKTPPVTGKGLGEMAPETSSSKKGPHMFAAWLTPATQASYLPKVRDYCEMFGP